MKKTASVLTLAAASLCFTAASFAQTSDSSKPAETPPPPLSVADRAWLDVRAAAFTPDFSKDLPAEPAARKAALVGYAAQFTAAADRAKDFYAHYPDHPKVDAARMMEVQALLNASQAGDATNEGRLNFTVEAFRADPKAATKFKAQAVAMHAFNLAMRGRKNKAERLAAIEQVARNLAGDFPMEPQGHESLLTVALATDDEAQARRIAEELLQGPSSPGIKEHARALLGRMDLVGKPIEAELTGADATTAMAAFKTGRATVLYTWASWSPGSLELAADLKARNPDANIIGLNLDQDQKLAEATALKEGLVGMMVYDERGMEGALAQRLKVRTAPQVCLIDAQGIIRDVRGEEDFLKKLQSLGL